jgi:hypothetical protein
VLAISRTRKTIAEPDSAFGRSSAGGYAARVAKPMKVGALAASARRALGEALVRVSPDVALDDHGYVVEVELNLVPGILRGDIADAFATATGSELDGKLRAPWSSSALAVNSFGRWQRDLDRFALGGISGFDGTPAFEAKCPNGVSSVPPHLDVLLTRGDDVVAVESKCTEYLARKTPQVSQAYLVLRRRFDERATSRWFGALSAVPEFELLDAYQLIKHYLGLRLTYPGRPLTLVYLHWEPRDAEAHPILGQHREEIRRFADLVGGDASCRFVARSYAEHWDALEALSDRPAWLPEHLGALRARYDVAL